MHRLAILAIVSTASLAAAADPQPALPVAWHGTWTGTMTVTDASDQATEVEVALTIAPVPDTRTATWKTTYGTGERAVVKDYAIVPVDGKPGRFRIDEKNGVLLDARLAGRTLYSQFEVAGAVLTARYELRGDVLAFEITSAKPRPEKSGKGTVQSYAVNAVQTADLKKK